MKNQFFQNEEEIKTWLLKHDVQNFTIIANTDEKSKTPWMVDVYDNVHITYRDLEYLPVQFNEIHGNFDISGNNLTFLKGSPKKIHGYFCFSNNQVKNLKDCPYQIDAGLIFENNFIDSLKYCPQTVAGGFYCNGNRLKSLKNGPHVVRGDYDCSDNQLKNLDYLPQSVIGKFYCNKNSQLKALQNLGFIEKLKEAILEKEQKRLEKMKAIHAQKMNHFNKKLNKMQEKSNSPKVKL